jgi:hypothetical protein
MFRRKISKNYFLTEHLKLWSLYGRYVLWKLIKRMLQYNPDVCQDSSVQILCIDSDTLSIFCRNWQVCWTQPISTLCPRHVRYIVWPLVDYHASSNKFRLNPPLWFMACKLVVHQAIRASSPRLMIHVAGCPYIQLWVKRKLFHDTVVARIYVL